ncbi:putative PLP-dependent enzyme possibly involved in cell wall biogenesis [Burkholderia sp. Ch1-1]|uniref:dTDP-3-amino-3, 6-dideoxy-alpha-D-galactopyranose transaminase n=1 Tax=Paraburkholderia dioscoreae TaxID=2604047 RepID=A0A5Q4ZAT9_9BURK|nr:DegT/DnrJ/EryC1/StrS family aminotransferase [Paraburkholderia dioscoreae]EIF33052.1 putative PLP-dependent enzyme possibly involved in cell wall biogenesis [Burkholderia sp. Ch1-1]VVD31869.1 dTDP-3-amino-3, 6-dideoxy-alpha-D-galactopyranose transaminase [Paraburkholderia dioscoreae]
MAGKVPLFSIEASNRGIDLTGAFNRVANSNWFILGNEVTNFEREFAEYIGVDNCVSLANGTDSLELALRALDVTPEHSVALVANAGFYGSTAVNAIGAHPLYADVDASSLNMSPAALRDLLSREKPKAIVVTHLYGQLAAIEEIVAIAAQAGVPVVEDCAQAHGAMRGGRIAGSFGAIGCFSFYPTKNLGALGDGGAAVCSDQALAQKLKMLRQYGWNTKYSVALAGGRNSRMDELQAAILREKLPHLNDWNSQRRAVARRYNAAFNDLPVKAASSVDADYVAHLYVIRVRNRDSFRAHLGEQQIATEVHYPIPDHLQAVYTGRSVSPRQHLPVTEQSAAEIVTLPCFPGMTEAQVDRVIESVCAYFKRECAQ